MSDGRLLLKGNEAVALGALDAGCRCYFGYPITPQNEIPEVMSRLLPEAGGQFVQAESELAASAMLLGAGACGIPAMTSSSSCGIALMQESLSYMAGSRIPGVIVNMMRGGPGLGDIGPSQGDYFQAVKGGGNGDHRNVVLAPSTAQECYDLMFRAFALAFRYANPVMLLGDALVAQTREPVRRQPPQEALTAEDYARLSASWRLEGHGRRGTGASPRLLKSVYLAEGTLAAHNAELMRIYESMRADAAWEAWQCEDAELVVVAFGSVARIARSAIRQLRQQGYRVGLFRPVTLFPWPDAALRRVAGGRRVLVLEQNTGQMVEDVRLALDMLPQRVEVGWHGIMPGLLVDAEDLLEPIMAACKED